MVSRTKERKGKEKEKGKGKGWFDTDYLGIDQGPILTMIENYRSEFIWNLMRRNRHIQRGLKAAGFSGGWLEGVTELENK